MRYFVFISLSVALLVGACDEKDYKLIESATDDYVSEHGSVQNASDGIDLSMYEKARIFPGLVDTLTEQRLDNVTLTLDLSRKHVVAADVKMAYLPDAIYSTGLYAGAGEKVTIELDDDVKGLSVQIGVHQRDLSSLQQTDRDPVIITAMPLFAGQNVIRNPYGGSVWIKRSGSDGADRTDFQLTVSGVYAAPDFIVNETPDKAAEWLAFIKTTTVPWMELRGKRYVFTVPTRYVAKQANAEGQTFVANLNRALQIWDEWILAFYQFYGLDGEDPAFPTPEYPYRAVMDVLLLNERFSNQNGSIIELFKSEEVTNFICSPEQIILGDDNIANVFGWLQLYMLMPSATFASSFASGTIPAQFSTFYPLLPNFYFFYKNGFWDGRNSKVWNYARSGDNIKINSTYTLRKVDFDNLINFAKADSMKVFTDANRLADANCYPGLAFFADIISYVQPETQKNGWQFLSWFNRRIALNNYGNRNMLDILLTSLTTYFNRDFRSLYDRWGLTAGDEAWLAASACPPIEKCIWQHDVFAPAAAVPLFDGKAFYTLSGKTPLKHLRGAWTAVAYSGDDASLKPHNERTDFPVANLFDSNIATFWHSDYDTYTDYTDDEGIARYAYHTDSAYYKATAPDFPYYVVIKTGDSPLARLDGVYLGLGASSEASIYNADVWNYDTYNFHPQHVIIETSSVELQYNEGDAVFENIDAATWQRVYDSDNDSQFKNYLNNPFYIDFNSPLSGVRAIRLVFDRDSHTAKDRPDDFPVDLKPGRPEFANPYLNRIQKIAEFGAYYYQ